MHLSRISIVRRTAAILALATLAGPSAARAGVAIHPGKAVIENAFLSIELSTAGKKLRTTSISNRLTGAVTPLEGDDFVIVLADGGKVKESDLALDRVEEVTAGGEEGLALVLTGEAIEVRMRLTMRPGEWWISRWLEIQGAKGRLAKLSLSEWRTQGTYGPPGPGKTTEGLGYPEGYGQAAYVDDLFFAIEHPGAENFARGKRIACRIPAFDELGPGKTAVSRRFVVGAAEEGGAPQAFARFIGERRANPARMLFVIDDRCSREKGGAQEAFEALVQLKTATGIPLDSMLLDEGWDLREGPAPLWTRLDPARFPGGWQPFLDVGKPVGLGLSLWFGPAGGQGAREKRVALGRSAGLEVNGDKLCLAGTAYRKQAIAAFSAWSANGMDLIEVEGFFPDCKCEGHGHPTGEGAAVAQMDALIENFAEWRKARRGIRIAFTAGSNPSPFWLQHADSIGRGVVAGGEASGDGEPFDRRATAIDEVLQVHRPADAPFSSFVAEDLDASCLAGTSDAAFERNAWWLAARTTLLHRWCVQPSDLTPERWKVLDQAAEWAKSRQKLFRLSRMVGGDPRQKGIYGFSAFEEGVGVLALRNPAGKPGALEQSLSRLLVLSRDAGGKSYILRGVYGETKALEGIHPGRSALKVELPPLAVAIFEVKVER
jgi:hypothetical protein